MLGEPARPRLSIVCPVEMQLPPLGPAYLAGALHAEGLAEVVFREGASVGVDEILSDRPDLVGFYSVTEFHDAAVRLALGIRARAPEIPLLIGGPHVSACPSLLERAFDIGVLGEGEETLCEILRLHQAGALSDPGRRAAVGGVVFRDGEKIVETPPRAGRADLDALPFPDHSIYAPHRRMPNLDVTHEGVRLPTAQIFASRGCPYECMFCQPRVLFDRYRMHGAARVAEEIVRLYRAGVRSIRISDDLFIVIPRRVHEIADRLEAEGVSMPFLAHVRAENVNPESVAALRRLGVVSAAMGLESGTNRVLKILKGPGASVERNERAIRLLDEAGIEVYGLFILGTPSETQDEMRRTIDWYLEMPFRPAQFYSLVPYPATRHWKFFLDAGLFSQERPPAWSSLDPKFRRPETAFYHNPAVPRDRFAAILGEARRAVRAKTARMIAVPSPVGAHADPSLHHEGEPGLQPVQ